MLTFIMILLTTLALQKLKSNISSGSNVLILQSVTTPLSSSLFNMEKILLKLIIVHLCTSFIITNICPLLSTDSLWISAVPFNSKVIDEINNQAAIKKTSLHTNTLKTRAIDFLNYNIFLCRTKDTKIFYMK